MTLWFLSVLIDAQILPLALAVFHVVSNTIFRVIARPRMKGGGGGRSTPPFLLSVFSASLATMLAISVMYHSG